MITEVSIRCQTLSTHVYPPMHTGARFCRRRRCRISSTNYVEVVDRPVTPPLNFCCAIAVTFYCHWKKSANLNAVLFLHSLGRSITRLLLTKLQMQSKCHPMATVGKNVTCRRIIQIILVSVVIVNALNHRCQGLLFCNIR